MNTIDSTQKALLIDLDNCPRQLKQLSENIKIFDHIILCYGGVEPKVHLDLVTILAEAIHQKRLDIVPMKKKGKNAADFGLAFWAGRLSASMEQNSEFYILSEDKDLDHVVNLLESLDRKVVRINGKTKDKIECNILFDQPSLGEQFDAMVDEIYSKLSRMGKGRPKTIKSLKNSLRSWLNAYPNIAVDDVLTMLMERDFISVNQASVVIYEPFEEPYGEDIDIPF